MSTKNGSVVCANKSKHFWSDLDIFVEKGGLLGRSFLFAGFCALDLKLDEIVTQMSSKLDSAEWVFNSIFVLLF